MVVKAKASQLLKSLALCLLAVLSATACVSANSTKPSTGQVAGRHLVLASMDAAEPPRESPASTQTRKPVKQDSRSKTPQNVPVTKEPSRVKTTPATAMPFGDDKNDQARSPANQPGPKEKKPAYSGPSPAVRKVALAGSGVSDDVTVNLEGAGKELTQTSISSSGISGKTGATAISPLIGGSVAAKRGSEQGGVSGIGFAARQNLFTPSANPASVRCAELRAAGFSLRPTGPCASHLGKRMLKRRRR